MDSSFWLSSLDAKGHRQELVYQNESQKEKYLQDHYKQSRII